MVYHQQGFVEVYGDSDMITDDNNARDFNHYAENFEPSFPIDNSAFLRQDADDNESAGPTIKSLKRELAAMKKELSATKKQVEAEEEENRTLRAVNENQAGLLIHAIAENTRLNSERATASSSFASYTQPPDIETYWSDHVSLNQAQLISIEVKKAKVEEDCIAAMSQLRDLTSRLENMQLQLNVEQLNMEHNQNKIEFQRGSQANIIINLAPGQTYSTASSPGSSLRRRSNGSGTSHVAQDASKVTKHSSSSLPIRSGTTPARRQILDQTVFPQAPAAPKIPQLPHYRNKCIREGPCSRRCYFLHDNQLAHYGHDVIDTLPNHHDGTE
ncbi:hypothetical protein HBI56_159140 [Parastagonospora nodorum]|uniref:Uncharacterized protein n=1 Tax=Phaeosphaeria nodorum (strain SN15 / ATCC MYA-4574 / FGSC 10173) TaxID=321614 RepID=A0A7U2EUY4_PHANO|nr:hypothetical protein HBH56_189850 [Parastagonospora nodorum]QRC92358.1 hypothetical protein JI435_024790 [Parastagonospora nodorum SN15]KAH3925024.1 hypothetical protein HBH54_185660 [Parastagonospora nodorum]KAH3954101.1 hypothetical protein HBH53_025010 [Parastagonospora nodorum]KAH3963769.1 hypothetical protein HBH51_164850 [Parastagonospora nodorum]